MRRQSADEEMPDPPPCQDQLAIKSALHILPNAQDLVMKGSSVHWDRSLHVIPGRALLTLCLNVQVG